MNWVAIVTTLIIGFNAFVLVYFLLLNTSYLLLFLLSLRGVFRFVRRTFFSDYRQIMQSEMTWPISILVAAHNEEKTIVETVRSLRMVNYSEFEIIVINDGSTDGTLKRLVEAFELSRLDKVYKREIATRAVRGVYGSLDHNITVVDKEQGGKPDALNAGINVSRYPLFCSIDADSVIEDNALLRVVKPFMEHPDETVAAGGIVRIVNGCQVREGRVVQIELPDKPLPVFQVIEYLRAFLSGRVGWSVLRSLLIISGAFGVYRKKEVIEIGGYGLDTDTEDLDLVVRLHRHMRENQRKYRVVFVPDPVCWTEVPENLTVLRRQRARWHRGLVQSLWAHKRILCNPRYGTLGTVAFPHAFFFEMLGPLIEVLGYIAVIISFLLGILNLQFFLLFFAVAVLYGVFLSIAAVLLEEISFRRYPGWIDLSKLIVFGILENFGYRQLLALFKLKALWDVLRRRRGWGEMDREGFRAPPEPAPTS
ncbi:MAG: glycosyltransferase [Acidobacteria bacterium]|nr:glycosyltransferase [Acidobacteriota bacterium]NIM63385.1 glycosyltransferase [Acidobacteriota bacterium]NIO60429.1 glycosyltransferase [Acidobacteriota bacterium]NIQ31524.1 glycosyltransferase [Acidobacteriota bacterium]NIQ86760.1 glycosyltransferase [Acidobacteriota bacterium]